MIRLGSGIAVDIVFVPERVVVVVTVVCWTTVETCVKRGSPGRMTLVVNVVEAGRVTVGAGAIKVVVIVIHVLPTALQETRTGYVLTSRRSRRAGRALAGYT